MSKGKDMRVRIIFMTLFMLTCGIMISCGIKEDTGFAVVREMRVVTVIAEPPEPMPNETIHIRGIAIDPESRELTYIWFNAPQVVDPKKGIPEDMLPVAFSEEFSWQAPATPGIYTLILLVIPTEYLPALSELKDFNMLQDIPHALAFTNITVSDNEERNHNPEIIDVVLEPEDSVPGDTMILTAVAADPDGDELQYAWLSLTPGLSSDYENPVKFKIKDNNLPAVIYLVVRDSKGGSDFQMIEIK